MSQCVPNWDLDGSAVPTRFNPRTHHSTSTSNSSAAADVTMLDYEIAELTWENGQLSMHGLGPPRVSSKHGYSSFPNPKYAWERPRAVAGTLESIVNLATQKPATGNSHVGCDDVDLVPWFDRSRQQNHQPSGGISAGAPAAAAGTVTMDALVPSETTNEEEQQGEGVHVAPRSQGVGPCLVGGSARADPFGGGGTCKTGKVVEDKGKPSVLKKASSVPRVPVAGEQSGSVSASVSRSGTFGGDSRHVPTVDTCERELGGFGLTSTSQGNTFSSSGRPATNNTTTVDDHDSVCHSRPQKETGNEEERKKGNSKSSLSTKRSRAAAIHNQSERKRRDKINQKMKMLQKLVPNSSKTDKASMLDEVIDYLKQLQAQVQMMSRMSMQSMMMPLAMQQQLQMSLMNPMAMGMGMGMGVGMGMDMNMNINPMAHQNLAGLPPVMNPTAAFMPMAAWDVGGAATDGRLPSQAAIVPTDPISTYLAYQSQPSTMEAYSRMVALIQQQQHASASKN